METIKVKIRVKEGDACMVRNYRKKDKEWEDATVLNVEVNIREDLSYRVSYRVVLDREGPELSKWGHKRHEGQRRLFLTVGDRDIQ